MVGKSTNGYGRSTQGFGISVEQSVELIIKTALAHNIRNPKQIAYILASAQHESENFRAPEEHYGRSQARKYDYRGGETYYGRGYIHLTHIDNYEKMGALLGMGNSLAKNPPLAMEPSTAAKIMVLGMRDGLFTGKKLERYINTHTADYFNARRIVNGVVRSEPDTLKVAQRCKSLAEKWEKELPSLLQKYHLSLDAKPDLSAAPTASATSSPTTQSPPASSRKPKRARLSSEQVQQLQSTLHALGYTAPHGQPLKADGIIGPHTRHALLAFQKDHQLIMTGTPNAATQQALKQVKPQKQPSRLQTQIAQLLPDLSSKQLDQLADYGLKKCAQSGVLASAVFSVSTAYVNGKKLLALHVEDGQRTITADIQKALDTPLTQTLGQQLQKLVTHQPTHLLF